MRPPFLLWHFRIIWAEVFQDYHRLPSTVIGDRHAFFGCLFTDKILISTGLSKTQHNCGLRIVCAECAVPLDETAAIGNRVFHCYALPWRDGEFLCPKERVAI